jgi:transcriptional regulator with XRE-family HTH domain
LNENLCRALLQARLSEEDVAARLEVDPKTVRRWLEGRVPYLRHRWALAAMLGQDEADLWPQARTARPLPTEVQAIYPHHDNVPTEVWQDFFRSAKREIDILTDSEIFLTADAESLAILTRRAKAGVQERICLSDPDWLGASDVSNHPREALCQHADLWQAHHVQIRTYRSSLNNAIYRADDELLVSPQAFGIPAGRSPVLRLRRTADSAMITTYLESFNRIWSGAQPLEPASP